MGKERILDRMEIYRLVNEEKKSQVEVARMFGVNKSSVSRALKELRPAIASAVSLEAGHKIVTRQLDVVDQLMKSNQTIEGMIEDLKKKLYGQKTDTPDVKNKEIRLVIKDLAEEQRRQWTFQMDVLKTMFNFQSISEFQAAVLETIGDANLCPGCGHEIVCHCGLKVDLKAQILLKLKEKRAIRAGTQFRP
jgi:predicted DNA-binding protein (UPF0251 family)